MPRILLLLSAGWTALLPAHVPVVICFCSHDGAAACPHAAAKCGQCDDIEGIAGTTPASEGGGCVHLESPQDLVPQARSADAGPSAAAVEQCAAPAVPAGRAEPARHEVEEATGPPIFLRVRALLI